VNLWTVGCADPRLTAQARSPMDKPGKTPLRFPHPCPQVGGLPTSFTAPTATNKGMNLIPGKGWNHQPASSLSLFSPEAVQTTGTVRSCIGGIRTGIPPLSSRPGRAPRSRKSGAAGACRRTARRGEIPSLPHQKAMTQCADHRRRYRPPLFFGGVRREFRIFKAKARREGQKNGNSQDTE